MRRTYSLPYWQRKEQVMKEMIPTPFAQSSAGTITRLPAEAFETMDAKWSLYTEFDFDKKIDNIWKAADVNRPGLLKSLYKALQDNHIKCELRTDPKALSYYEKIIADYYSDPDKSLKQISDRIVTVLCDKLADYPTPQTHLMHILDHCGDPRWKNDSLRMRLLKQLIVYGDFLKSAYKQNQEKWIQKHTGGKTAEDVATRLDEGIFDLYLNDSSAVKARKCEAIRIAQYFANGTFFTNSSNIKPLYLLAICFHMTYYYEGNGVLSLPDPKTDITKNLFRGFYVYNPICEKKNGTAIPSERGINPKNFAEIIYLYYLCNDPALDEETVGIPAAARKIMAAEKMLDAVRRFEDAAPVSESRGTSTYRDSIAAYMTMSETELQHHILNDFLITCTAPDDYMKRNREAFFETVSQFVDENDLLTDGNDEQPEEQILRLLTKWFPDQIRRNTASAIEQLKNSSKYKEMEEAEQTKAEAQVINEFEAEAVKAEASIRTPSKADGFRASVKRILRINAAVQDCRKFAEYVYTAFVYNFGSKEITPFSAEEAQNSARNTYLDVQQELRDNIKVLELTECKSYKTDLKTATLIGEESLYKQYSQYRKTTIDYLSYQFDLSDLIAAAEAKKKRTRKPEKVEKWDRLLLCLQQANTMFGINNKTVVSPMNVKRSDLLVKLMYLYAYKEFKELCIDSKNSDQNYFSDLYFDFWEFSAPYLEKALYPPLSSRNIFDMLIVAALYKFSFNGYDGSLCLENKTNFSNRNKTNQKKED